MLTAGDEYPIHQSPLPIRQVGTSDRNFYDRYYFNCHSCSDELFLVLGMGQYPNLGTQDAFATVRLGAAHHVVRASRLLDDRTDTSVGPFRLEIIEPLRKLRFVLEPTEHDIAFDLTWEGTIAPWHEANHHVRKHDRVVFDTCRFAQNGRWTGSLEVAGKAFDVTPDHWWGARDRSWGVRPIGEPEIPGIQTEPVMTGMWNYVPMQFDDHSILIIIQEEGDGRRTLESAVRIWNDPDKGHELLGRPDAEHTLDSGTRMITTPSAFTIRGAGDPIEITCTPLVHNYLGIGTGYGLGDEFRHGMYLGPDLVVEGKSWPMEELEQWAWYAIVEHCARFEYGGNTGYGMFEHMFIGDYPKYGLDSRDAVAP